MKHTIMIHTQQQMYGVRWLMTTVHRKIFRHCFHRQRCPFWKKSHRLHRSKQENISETVSVCSHRSILQTIARTTASTVDLTATINQPRTVECEEEIEKEMAAIARDRSAGNPDSDRREPKPNPHVEYIGEACKIARKYFKVIGLEVYPMNSDEYAYLHECGADYVTVFQETYNSDKYETLHLAGHKRIFPYRVNAQERALKGGMRGVGFCSTSGLDDFRKDAFATGYHAYFCRENIHMQRSHFLLPETSSDHQQRPDQSDGCP